ncbi:hydroxypyruvate isomerase family protein [Candidatus Palauibacter sp.]|uniref:hydroxypyruvate isomerase family protein n=1 Tax=Candidatus Palauibacter sp. TaxID=3101350 RepID=UPI003B594FAF
MADPDARRNPRAVSRRDAIRVTGAASLGLLVHGGASPSPAHADVASRGAQSIRGSTGAVTQSVARWCFEDIPLVPFCRGVADIGLPAIDLLTLPEWDVAHDHGLIVSCGDVAAGSIEDGLNEPRNHAGIIEAFERHIPRAARESVPNVICFFGNRRGMEDGVGIENSIRCLEACAPIAESEGVTILVEALNSKPGGHVDYMGDHMDYALEIIRAVDSPRVKILYDIYHMQIMEGDIIRTLTDASPWIGHYHTGGVPGRAEIDDSQELNYPPIVRAIVDTGFDGYMAHEFIPRSGNPLRSLREAVELCAV